MKANVYSRRLVIAVVALILAGCSSGAADVGGQPVVIDDMEQLLGALQDAGLPAAAAGEIEQPFFEPVGRVIEVEGEQIQVFEFEEAQDARQAAEAISPDGTTIGTSQVTWIAPPHFFQAGDLIVLYVGDQAALVTALTAALGAQIAGG